MATGEFEDTLTVFLGPAFSTWQIFFADRAAMKVYWKSSDGNYYGSYRQRADVAHDSVDITQYQPDTTHPAVFP